MKIINFIIQAFVRFIKSLKVAAIVFAGIVFWAVLGFEVLAIVWALACYAVMAYLSCKTDKKTEHETVKNNFELA